MYLIHRSPRLQSQRHLRLIRPSARVRWLIVALFIALLQQSLAIPTLAQSRSTALAGRVSDQSGAVVSGARVILRQKSNGFERTVITDDTGTFAFNDLLPANYVLSASSIGFATFTQPLDLSAPDRRALDITLTPGAIADKVTVTATRTESLASDISVPVNIIEREEIERRTLSTIGDLFRQLPGVSVVNEGPFQVRPRIRGLDSNRVLILVDGERLNHTRTSTANSGIEIGLVDVEQIESIEVARGSGSVLYGTDALAGTINIITQDALPRRADGFRFGGGLNGLLSSNDAGRRGSAYLTGANARFAFRIAQTLDRFANYHAGGDGGDASTEVFNSQYHGSDTRLLGRLFLNDFQSLRVSYDRRRAANIGVPGVVGVFTAFFPFSNRDKVSGRYEGYDLTARLTRLAASVYYQSQERNFSNVLSVPAVPPAFPGQFQFSETNTDTDTAGFDLQTNFSLSDHQVLIAGTSYFRDRNRDARFIERLSPDFSTFPPGLVRSQDRSKSVPNATFGNLALFAQDEYQPTRWLHIIGGLRFDRFDIESERTAGFDLPPFFTPSQIADLQLGGLDEGLNLNDTAVSGDVGVVVKPIASLSLTARVGRSFRQPNLFERFFTDFGSAAGFVVGNPHLEPESGVNFDTGVRLYSRRLAASLSYFNNTYEDFLLNRAALDRNGLPITISAGTGRPPIPVFQTVNVGRARIQGLEADFEASLPVAHQVITVLGNLSYLRGSDLETHTPLDFLTPLKTVFGLRWRDQRDRLWSEYSVRIVNRQERLSPAFLIANGGAEPGFVAHDLRGGWHLRREHYATSFTLGLENVSNRFYHEQFAFAPARGRSLTLGVNFKFF